MSDDRNPPPAVPDDSPNLSDEALLAGLVDGRLDALDTFYERYRSMAYGIARRITADDALAEDVVQEAFLGVWRGAANYVAGRGSVKTWLLAIVHHRAVDAVRRRRATVDLPDETEGALTPGQLVAPDVWPDIAARLDEAVVADALAAQPGSQTVLLAADNGSASGLGVVGADGTVKLAMRGLAPTAGTQVYTAWSISGGGAPVPIGEFTVGSDGTATGTAHAPAPAAGVVVALTLEAHPGATTPTLPIVAKGVARPASG